MSSQSRQNFENMASSQQLPRDWDDHCAVYPTFDEIIVALQDDGVPVASKTKLARETGIQKRRFLKIAKLATQAHKKLKEAYNPGALLDDNVSHGKNLLAMEILQSRKHVDKCDTDTAFHAHGKNGKVCLIYNDPMCAGLNLAIKKFQEAHEHNIKSRAANRTPEDGMRLAGVLIKAEHRAAVAGIMSNKKDRKKSDVSGDTTRNFFAEALADFSDMLHEVSNPREELWLSEHLEDDRDRWDPNSAAVFEHTRTPEWLMDAWFTYIRPRCKKALDKWNKDTGGGDGTPAAFIDFCGNDKWLVWVFLHDFDANFLLANDASGQLPNHLQLEAGFDTNMSDITDEDSGSKASSKRMKDVEKQLSDLKAESGSINDLTSMLSECLKTKRSGDKENHQDVSNTPSKLSYDACLRQANCYRKQILELEDDDTLEDDMKAEHMECLKERRKRFLSAAIQMETAKRNKPN